MKTKKENSLTNLLENMGIKESVIRLDTGVKTGHLGEGNIKVIDYKYRYDDCDKPINELDSLFDSPINQLDELFKGFNDQFSG